MSGLLDIKCLYDAFIYFNECLFDGELSTPVITWVRKRNARGYFFADRYEYRLEALADEKPLHEIAFNPDVMKGHDDRAILSTLVHEMCHQWQQEHGKKNPRKCYHNKEWARKMEDCGLIPSSTGQPGGKRTGASMTHYIPEGGLFDHKCDLLFQDGWRLTYQGIPVPKEVSKAKDKIKYTCPKCLTKAWGKPGIELACVRCNCELTGEED